MEQYAALRAVWFAELDPVLEGERKHVTVLFADVKGSMELSQQVDAGTPYSKASSRS